MLDDIKARLVEALGPSVPVLLPSEFDTPVKGRKPGQPGGLTGYLTAHPQGYVQLLDTTGLTSVGYGETHLIPLQIVAPTPTASEVLADAVRRTLASHPGVRVTPYDVLSPASTQHFPDHAVTSLLLQGRRALEP